MKFASDSTATVTKNITAATIRFMNVRDYTRSAKIESGSHTSDLTAALPVGSPAAELGAGLPPIFRS